MTGETSWAFLMTATGPKRPLGSKQGLGKRVQFLVFGLFCKLSVMLTVIKKKKKVVKEIKMIMWVRICFYIAKKPGIGSFVSHGMWIVYAAYKFNSRK